MNFVVYLLGTYKSFNRLQDSAVKFSEGDLDTNIFIPKGGILFELSYALDKMAKRLKKQIVDMQKLENFRSEFIANVSHEVKTPLTGIMSSVEILEDECSSENMKITKCINILKKQANRLNSLIQDILSLSELERRQIMEKKEFCRFNLKRSIENCVAVVYTSEISINTNLENIAYYGDSSLIEQAVINLLTNAIRYSKFDRIDVSLFKTSDSVKIIVKDYGVGIPTEHLPYIFENFYRTDKVRSRDLGGTGLGLAIVKNIIKLHSGEIEAKSDNGCEFVITLPLC